jgi:hypothetical protein
MQIRKEGRKDVLGTQALRNVTKQVDGGSLDTFLACFQ